MSVKSEILFAQTGSEERPDFPSEELSVAELLYWTCLLTWLINLSG